ncbi:hypothetical protein POM88_025839 [Heracleum sosnowskyi]|uniref:Replication factor A C-terminal domain-containing protein n=1 Tax=Heracleum sosnowskyi TaxID=360622 RepID=A0AAD8MK49_9APIA|nr:hypothetical protein POM88_025839 [Heracleum sosnowskyi]
MWPSMSNASNGNQGLKGYNLILLDDDDCHVHAFIYADNWKHHAEKIEEGSVYIMSNFYTKQSNGSLKPASSSILINFSPSTSVQKVEEDDFMIPLHKFEFVDLSDLFNLETANANIEFPEFSTDVIGVLEDFEYVSKIKIVYGEKKIVKFRITDGRHSHKVTVWEALATKTDAAYRAIEEQPNTKEPIIVIISSTKLRTFRNSVQINTLPSSKIYLNLDNEVVTAMRQRLNEEGYVQLERTISPTTQIKNVSAPAIETLTLKELSERTSSDYLKRSFLCKVNVKNVEQNDSWWYNGCHKSKCNEEVSKLEGKYRCFKCTRNYPLPQKNYPILCSDETDKAYPAVVKELSGRDIIVQIELNDDNILLSSTVYHATDAYQSVICTSSKSETTISSFGASAFGDNNLIEVSDTSTTPGNLKRKIASNSFAVLESVRKNLEKISF